MKVFISWSGTSSRMVAEALSDWLQRVIQAVKPFYSPDIDKGAKWSNEIDAALEGTRFGIICLTPDNLKSEWIHYESGALSKTKDASIWTFLLDLKPSDVKQPLGRFQHTLAEKADILKMLKSINAKLVESGGESLKDGLLEEIFSESWAKLETRLDEAKKSIRSKSDNEVVLTTENIRTDNDKLDEILDILRTQQRNVLNNSNHKLIETKPSTSEKIFQTIVFEVTKLDGSPRIKYKEIDKIIVDVFNNPRFIRNGEQQKVIYSLSLDSSISEPDIKHMFSTLRLLLPTYKIEITIPSLKKDEGHYLISGSH